MSCVARICLIAAACLTAAVAHSEVPGMIPVQGRLTDSAGVPVDTGTANFTFAIYDVETGGVEIWPGSGGETSVVPIGPNGVWQAILGASMPLTADVFSDSVRWLEIVVDAGSGPDTLSRVRVLTAPYVFTSELAHDAEQLGGLGPGEYAAAAHLHIPADIVPQGGGSGLDADMLDGQEGTYYTAAENLTGVIADSILTASGAAQVDVDNEFTTTQTLPDASFTTSTAPPFTVASSDMVPGLNADLLDGMDATGFAAAAHAHAPAEITPQGDGSGLDADLLDGMQAAEFATEVHDHEGLWSINGANYFYNGGRVGIGTTSPEQMLHVVKGALTGVVPNGGSIGVFESDNTGYLSIITPDFAERGIMFAEPASAQAGSIIYNNSNTPDGLQFRTGFNLVSMALESNGRLSIGSFTGAGRLRVTGNSDNGTVVFPNDAIGSEEILNEAGIAADVNAAIVILTSTDMQTIASVTIDIPEAGYIVLEGKSNGNTYGTTLRNQGVMQIDETPGGSIVSPYFATFGLVGHANTAIANSFPIYVQRIYFKTAGSYTFYLEAAQNTGNNVGAVTRVGQSMLMATFVPTSYGTVSVIEPQSEAFGFSSAAAPGAVGDEGVKVDLRELELRALRLRLEAQQAEEEYEAALQADTR